MTRILLLVEDNASDEKLALVAFNKSGVPCEIVVARDGAEALDYVFATGKHAGRDPAARPAVILLDLMLPRISGLDVLRQIRATPETRLLPVVMLTASGEDEDVRRCYELGANAYLRKPVDFSEFADAARTLCTFWLRYNQLPPPRTA